MQQAAQKRGIHALTERTFHGKRSARSRNTLVGIDRILHRKEASMNISRHLCIAILVVLAAAGCDPGGNCDHCETDADCDSDKSCSDFEGGDRRCTDADTWTCTETTYY